jgi:hypothetical protein
MHIPRTLPRNIRSATVKEGSSCRLTLGEGRKLGIDGIHGEAQTSTLTPQEIEMQAPFQPPFYNSISLSKAKMKKDY